MLAITTSYIKLECTFLYKVPNSNIFAPASTNCRPGSGRLHWKRCDESSQIFDQIIEKAVEISRIMGSFY